MKNRCINSIDEALQAVWDPKINILLLNVRTYKPQLLTLEDLLSIYGEDFNYEGIDFPYHLFDFNLISFPYHLFKFSLITRIPEGFLSNPLLQLNNLKPEESNAEVEDMLWAEINDGCRPNYELYGLVDKTYYIGNGRRFTELSSVVSKTKSLLYSETRQSPQCSYLERALPSNLHTHVL